MTGLSRVVPLAGRNTQLPILQNILLQLRDGVLHMTGTDLEIGVHTIVTGKVEQEGGCTVVARKFMEYVQQLPSSNPLQLELKDQALHLDTTGFHAQFPTIPEDDFPLLPQPTSDHPFTLSATLLCRGLVTTLFAAARDATRPEIHSVFMRSEGNELRLAATDSFRLAEEVIELEDDSQPFMFLLPLSTAQEVVRLFSDQDKVEIFPQDNHITFQAEGITLSSRLVDGKYPDYQQIIPQNFVTTGQLQREVLIRALKTLLVFLPRESRRVQLVVRPSAGVLSLSVGGGEAGVGQVELDFEGEGKELQVLFNIQYLLDGAQSLSGKECQLKFVGNTDPAVLRSPAEEDRYVYVVMPIQA